MGRKVCDRLRKEIGDKAFKTWFGEVEPGESKGGKVRLYAPTRFVRDWVSRHYGDRVLAYWHAVDGEVSSVEVNLVPPPPPRRPNDIIAMPPVPAPQNYQQPMPRLGPAIGRGADDGFSGSRGALHLRQLRGRQAQRVRLCRRAQHRRAGQAAARAQPALYFRRRRPRQDPPDACHLARHPRARSQDPRALSHGRELREPLHHRRCAPRTPASSRSCSATSTC